MDVLLEDDLGRLTLRRLRPWHRLLARGRAARLDRELAAGTGPEANASLAARAARLTSTGYRRDLAASLLRMLAAAGESPAVMQTQPAAAPRSRSSGAPIPGGPARPDTRRLAGSRDWLGAAPAVRSSPGAPRSPRVPLRLARISQSAPQLAELASRLVEPGPVPVQGVAMVSQLLADGTGPLYREACPDDLGCLVEQATHALAR
jgi:hypothetical protein